MKPLTWVYGLPCQAFSFFQILVRRRPRLKTSVPSNLLPPLSRDLQSVNIPVACVYSASLWETQFPRHDEIRARQAYRLNELEAHTCYRPRAWPGKPGCFFTGHLHRLR